jgi:rhodanese-related sulfurtransferase
VDVPEIDVATAAAQREAGAFLLDVRQPDEYHEVHATGAVLIPLAEVAERVGDLPTDEPVYVICRSGARSERAALVLRRSGLDAVNVAGGTMAWVEAGLPVTSGAEPG